MRTVWLRAGNAVRLGVRLADANASRLEWRLRIGVDADAMLIASAISRVWAF